LFAGPEGVGKKKVARALAQALNCLSSPGTPCGRCSSCVRIASQEHPDVVELVPDTSKARPTIKIEQVREVTRQVCFKPYEARKRVLIVDGAEALTEEGSNALLKTLEEPTGETNFVLITAQARFLLPTIRSRCQTLRFGTLPQEVVMAELAQRGVEATTAAVAVGFGQGSLGAALALTQEGALDGRREILDGVAALGEGDALACFQLADKYAKSADLQGALDALRTFYRDVALRKAGANPARLLNVDRLGQIDKAARRLTMDDALGHIDRISAAQRDLRRYVDAKLVLENLWFSLAG
jgi:DNA polymerase-3 subunit delta'